MRSGRCGHRAILALLAVGVATLGISAVNVGGANASPSSFGAATPGANIDTPGQNHKFGTVYPLFNMASLTAFRFYARGGTARQVFTPAIYQTDSNGNPTTLVVQGTEVSIASGQAAGWVSSPLPAINIQPGNYLLALMAGASDHGARLSFTAGAGLGDYNPNTYPTASPSWGILNPTRDQYSFAVDYLISPSVSSTTSVPSGGTSWFVGSGGQGNCSQLSPCGSIDAAYKHAGPGDSILLAPGNYPQQTVNYRSAADTWSQNVTVRGSGVSVAGVTILSPHLTLSGLTITAFSQSSSTDTTNANYTRFENDNLTAELYLGGDHVAVTGSKIAPSYYNANPLVMNGINTTVAANRRGPDDVLIENNEIGPAYATPDAPSKGLHNETVQVYQGTNITIRDNLIWAGATTGTLAIGEHYGTAIKNVLVENNFIEQCGAVRPVPTGAYCSTYYAVTAGAPSATTPTLTFRNNTIRGSFQASNANIVGNIIATGGGYVFGCDGGYTYNLLGVDGTWGACSATNQVVAPTTINFATDGWHLATGSPGINFGVPDLHGWLPKLLPSLTNLTESLF